LALRRFLATNGAIFAAMKAVALPSSPSVSSISSPTTHLNRAERRVTLRKSFVEKALPKAPCLADMLSAKGGPAVLAFAGAELKQVVHG